MRRVQLIAVLTFVVFAVARRPRPGRRESNDRRRLQGPRAARARPDAQRRDASPTSKSIRTTRRVLRGDSRRRVVEEREPRQHVDDRSSTTAASFNLCCVVIDPKNSNIVWLGTGENSNPRSSTYGDGLYKSTDGGETWTRVGLENVRAHRQHQDRSAQLRRRLRRGAGTALVRRRRPRRLQDDRRRQDVEGRADREPGHGRQRSRDRSEQSRRALRVDVAAPARASAR